MYEYYLNQSNNIRYNLTVVVELDLLVPLGSTYYYAYTYGLSTS